MKLTSDLTEISVRIEKESDLYDPFDPKGELLSSGVMSYIMDRYSEVPLGKRATITFFCSEDIDKERAVSAYRRRLETLRDVNRRDRKVLRLDMARLYIIGGIIIAAGLILKAFLDELPMEIVSIMGTFAVWEATSILLTKTPRNTIDNKKLEVLSEAELIFKK